jgi:hypothetical protein
MGGARLGHAVDQIRKRSADSGQTLTFSQSPSIISRNHHSVGPRWKLGRLERKRLPKQALDAIALDRAPDLP